MKTFEELKADILKEDGEGAGAPTNNVGGGAIAGTQGDPPMAKYRRKKFAGHETFEVDSDTFHKARLGKLRYHRYSRYVGEDELGQAIREYGRANPRHPIVLQDSSTGAMMYLKYGNHPLKHYHHGKRG